MGFLDSFTDEGENTKKDGRLKARVSFTPLRLSSHKNNSVDLVLKLKNESEQSKMVSVEAEVPKNSMLGFDESCINKRKEKQVGKLRSGEEKKVILNLWANNQTKEGKYPVDVTVYSHYQDYDKVLNYLDKNTSIRVV